MVNFHIYGHDYTSLDQLEHCSAKQHPLEQPYISRGKQMEQPSSWNQFLHNISNL